MFFIKAKRICTVILGAILLAISLNFFLIEAKVYSSGFTGMAQLISSSFDDFFNIQVSTGILFFLFNIPVFLLGWFKVGRGFTIYSMISVGLVSLFLAIIPVIPITDDIILNAVAGGVVGGIGIGITLKQGASTGGMDIIAMVLSRRQDKPLGAYFLILNGTIVAIAGIIYEPENALYTMLSLFISTQVIDAIHTRHQKVTVMIITEKAEALHQAIHEKLLRGLTIMPAKGAFSGKDRHMLYLVVTRYELYDLEKIIQHVDPQSFTNIVETAGVLGYFRRDD